MKTRFIGTNIRFIQDAMDHFKDTSKVILFLDYKKAFDSVSHEFIFCLLHHIGLPNHFVQWVTIMYGDVTSLVHHKTWLTPMIPIGQGVRQGCLLSCHLFNLVGQVLIFYLKDHGFFNW